MKVLMVCMRILLISTIFREGHYSIAPPKKEVFL